MSWKVFLSRNEVSRNEVLVYFISNVQSPCPNEKCSVFSIYTVSKFASPLFKYFSCVLLQPFQTVAGFLTQHGLISVLLVRFFCASQNIVLLVCLFSKQNNTWRYTSTFPLKALCHVEVIQGLVYNKKLQCGNIFSILLPDYNKRIPCFLEHLRVSPIRGHVVLKLPVFQTPIIKWKENFVFHRLWVSGKNRTLAFFSQYGRNKKTLPAK